VCRVVSEHADDQMGAHFQTAPSCGLYRFVVLAETVAAVDPRQGVVESRLQAEFQPHVMTGRDLRGDVGMLACVRAERDVAAESTAATALAAIAVRAGEAGVDRGLVHPGAVAAFQVLIEAVDAFWLWTGHGTRNWPADFVSPREVRLLDLGQYKIEVGAEIDLDQRKALLHLGFED